MTPVASSTSRNLSVADHNLALAVPPQLVEVIAQRVAELMAERIEPPAEDRWMSTRNAAAYLGLTPNALHKLTAAREVPFAQDAPGGKCWFLRSELDAWRRNGG